MKAIVLAGDWHGDVAQGISAVETAISGKNYDEVVVIQAGDFGIWPETVFPEVNFKVYFIDGNHEHFGQLFPGIPPLLEIKEPMEIRPNFVYVPRGTVLDIQGKTIAFLGGGDSLDRASRVEGYNWFREETIRYADTERLFLQALNKHVDLMVTHTPPQNIVAKMTAYRSAPIFWKISSHAVEAVWRALDTPPLVCGHMHEEYMDVRVTVLPEFGVRVWEHS